MYINKWSTLNNLNW